MTSVLLAFVLIPLSGVVAFARDGNNCDRAAIRHQDDCNDDGSTIGPPGPPGPPGPAGPP